jgi:hypothetical protein
MSTIFYLPAFIHLILFESLCNFGVTAPVSVVPPWHEASNRMLARFRRIHTTSFARMVSRRSAFPLNLSLGFRRCLSGSSLRCRSVLTGEFLCSPIRCANVGKKRVSATLSLRSMTHPHHPNSDAASADTTRSGDAPPAPPVKPYASARGLFRTDVANAAFVTWRRCPYSGYRVWASARALRCVPTEQVHHAMMHDLHCQSTAPPPPGSMVEMALGQLPFGCDPYFAATAIKLLTDITLYFPRHAPKVQGAGGARRGTQSGLIFACVAPEDVRRLLDFHRRVACSSAAWVTLRTGFDPVSAVRGPQLLVSIETTRTAKCDPTAVAAVGAPPLPSTPPPFGSDGNRNWCCSTSEI